MTVEVGGGLQVPEVTVEVGGGVQVPEVTVEVGGGLQLPEVTVEVGGGFAEASLLVLLQRVLHVRGEEAPDCRCRQLNKYIIRLMLN